MNSRPLAVYVHWPFCRVKCPYCDFNSHEFERLDQAAWRAAYLRELDGWAEVLGPRPVTSVFFGGGTPSLMAPETVAVILEKLNDRFGLDGTAEITLEANPTSSEADNFADFRAAGVNRLSLGVQSFDAGALAFLGRRHSVDEALAAIALARRTFPRFSFDLIYALPGQTVSDWDAQLDRALAEAADHLSVYQLTIEAGTRFHRDRVEAADEASAEVLFQHTAERLAAAGLPAYEVSNHARPGAESRHNLVYWTGGDYLGLGPGAHGRPTLAQGPAAQQNWRAPERWLEAVAAAGRGLQRLDALDAAERATEMVMTGLRLAGGIDRAVFEANSGLEPEAVIDVAARDRLIAAGFVENDARGLRCTAEGGLRLDAVTAALLGA